MTMPSRPKLERPSSRPARLFGISTDSSVVANTNSPGWMVNDSSLFFEISEVRFSNVSGLCTSIKACSERLYTMNWLPSLKSTEIGPNATAKSGIGEIFISPLSSLALMSRSERSIQTDYNTKDSPHQGVFCMNLRFYLYPRPHGGGHRDRTDIVSLYAGWLRTMQGVLYGLEVLEELLLAERRPSDNLVNNARLIIGYLNFSRL